MEIQADKRSVYRRQILTTAIIIIIITIAFSIYMNSLDMPMRFDLFSIAPIIIAIIYVVARTNKSYKRRVNAGLKTTEDSLILINQDMLKPAINIAREDIVKLEAKKPNIIDNYFGVQELIIHTKEQNYLIKDLTKENILFLQEELKARVNQEI